MFIVHNPETGKHVTTFEDEQTAHNFCKGTPFEVWPA